MKINLILMTALGLTAMTSTAFAGSETSDGVHDEAAKASLTVEVLPADAPLECKQKVAKALEDCGVKKAKQPKRPRTRPVPAPPPVPVKGDPGKDGAKGERGEQGARGAKGEKGDPGKDGRDGIDGKDGRSIQVGIAGGVLALSSKDDTTYFGAVPAVRFVVPVGENFSLTALLGLPLSLGNSESPVGTFGVGILGYEVAEDWHLEVGGGYTAFDYDRRLDAKMAFITGLAGLKYDISENLDLGREHDQGSPAFAYGGFLGITLHTAE